MFFTAYKTFSKRQILKKEAYLFVETLNSARKKASAKQAYCSSYTGTYQVSWTTSTYSITAAGCSSEFSYTLPSAITIDASGSVTYKTIGLSSATECILLADTATSQCRKVSIDSSGTVNEALESDCACP
jgi:hypothetical protein